MNIKQCIALLMTLVFAALAVIGGFAFLQARSNSEQVRHMTEGVVASAIASVELMTQLKDVQIAALAMVSAAEENRVRLALDEVAARKQALTRALQAQHAQADSQAQRGLIEAAQESMQNYFASINDTAQFKLAGQAGLAEANMSATVDQYLREQGQMIDAVQVEKRRSKDEAIDRLNHLLSDTAVALMGISAAAALALGAIGMLLYRQVIHPIAQMEAQMTQIAASQDFGHRLEIRSNDEIGRSMQAFNTMLEKIEQSTELVRQKAADIQAMLRHVPQGILTVQPDGTVHHEYSQHLEQILETREIAGRNAMDLVLKDTSLGEDTRSQVVAALSSCLGKDVMNFAFNSHLLPKEIQRRCADGTAKVLDLSWAPITAEDGTVTRLLLCVRDVTELRELVSAVDLLFRNTHTIRGNARSCGLLQPTRAVHRVEQDRDELDALLERLQVRDGDSHATLVATVQHTRSALQRLDARGLGPVLEEVLRTLPALALERGKEEPRVRIADTGVGIRGDAVAALQGTFMHLQRKGLSVA